MARTADKPGTYRIRAKGADWLLTGVDRSGRRIKVPFDTEANARSAVATFFPTSPAPSYVVNTTPAFTAPSVDDWGIPLVRPETTRAVADVLGVPPPIPPPPVFDVPPVEIPDPADEKKKAESLARAKSICEFLGIAWAAGDVWVAKRMTRSLGKEPVQPSTKQVQELAKTAQSALTELVGDMEIGPWTMLILLSIALPVSMIIQSPKAPKKVEPDKASEPLPSHLSAV